jgi:hypothetical protein
MLLAGALAGQGYLNESVEAAGTTEAPGSAENGGAIEPGAPDDIAGHAAEAEMRYLIDQGVMEGVAEGVYEPDRTVTRDEAAALLHRALFSAGDIPEVYGIADVSKDNWAYAGVHWAVNSGVSNGIGTDESGSVIFDPKGIFSKEQLATMLHNYIVKNNVPIQTTRQFVEVADIGSCSAWASEAMAFMQNNNLLKLDEYNNFYPKERASRADCAVLIYRIIARGPSGEAVDDPAL